MFKPKMMNNKNYNKTYGQEIKQKGYKNFIKRNRAVIRQKEENKKKEEEMLTGSNYEKTIKMKFQPPKIKDLESTNANSYISKNSRDNSDINSNDDDNYEIDIKIPNGKIIKFKFNIKDDINKKVDDICKIFDLNENIKQKIIKRVEEIRDYYINEEEDDETEF